MAFASGATSQASDNFDRGDENPLAAPWATQGSCQPFSIVTNVAVPNFSTDDCGALYMGRTWQADQASKAALTASGTAGAGQGMGLVVRGNTSDKTSYWFIIDAAGATNATIARRVPTYTAVDQWTQAYADNDTWEFSVSGQSPSVTLTVYRNGSQVRQYVDTAGTVPTSGYPGIAFSSTDSGTTTANDWEGGELASGQVGKIAFLSGVGW